MTILDRLISPLGTPLRTLLVVLTGITAVGGFAGCSQQPDQGPATELTTANSIDEDELLAKLDTELQWTYSNRHLNLRDHAAWQILHGALAYKSDFMVEDVPGGQRVSAVDHLLSGGHMKGWTTEPGVVLNEETGQRGLRAILETGTKTGQGHADQWLAVLAQCDLTPSQTIIVDGQQYTMEDFVKQVQWDVPRNVEREYSWTLIGLTTYLPTSSTWTASDGKQWSIERLIEIECEQELATSACGGTHRLIGITMALNHHLRTGGKLEGVWKTADEKIQAAISQAKLNQNPDGSFSTRYFEPGGKVSDLATDLGVTGHILEFLTLAMTDEQLREPWVTRSVWHLCELFHKTRPVPLECGALYHAAHGLVLYRTRVYGERNYAVASVADAGQQRAE